MNRFTICALFLFVCTTAPAGPLTPPGAPAPTMKTLDEVEARTPIHAADIPLVISQPGSYYLAENVNYSGAEHGIKIIAPDVTIDLNGFALNGPGADSTFSNVGIETDPLNSGTDPLTSNTVVINGKVAHWPTEGIRINSGRVENCVVAANGRIGIAFISKIVPGNSVVSGCLSENNGSHGIFMGQPGLVINNSCSLNNSTGISTAVAGIRVENNNLTENAFYGLSLHTGSIAIKNTASGNAVNFGFNSGSTYGPIVNMTTAADEITNTNPWANFSY